MFIGSSKFTQQTYLDTLKMMYELFGRARREGLVALESDTEDPEKARCSPSIRIF